ncbi:MAG: ABC transporter substrate-binding protein [Rhizobiaceae bacterium]|nr:ABC transporter substrate-binding protein [Rhizobiaceae bacterium]
MLAPAMNASAQEPLKVGLLTVRSGPLAGTGAQTEAGFKVFLEQRKNIIEGREVQLFVADTTGNPAVARTKTQELIERDGVEVIIGAAFAFEALAIEGLIRQAKVPSLAGAGGEDLTQRKINPWFVRVSSSSAQVAHPFGEYAYKTLGYRKIVTIGDDTAYQHEFFGGFTRTFKEAGGAVIQKIWAPLGSADYAGAIASIDGDADAVVALFTGANALKFLRQYAEYGMKDKMPLLTGAITVDESFLQDVGDNAVGVISAGWYSAAHDSHENRDFVSSVKAATEGVDPGIYAIQAYSAGLALEAALKTLNGQTKDKDAFIKALRSVEIPNDPRGPWKLDDYGNPITNVYIRKVVRKDGRLQSEEIATIPNVSQFWTYDPQEFLKAKIYTRDGQ